MKDARKVLDTYKKLLSIIARRAPVMVAMTFVLAIVSGALIFASTLVNQRIVDDGLRVASGAMAFGDYFPWLALLELPGATEELSSRPQPTASEATTRAVNSIATILFMTISF